MHGKQDQRAKADWIIDRPIAHRGLHDKQAGIFENTLSAARAAAARGFHIEVDLQPSRDGIPMVFHDYTLERMTGEKGNVRDLTAAELGQLRIGGAEERIPTLMQLLDLVVGRVGLVLELKGQAGGDEGFVAAVSRCLAGYDGRAAIMSFNHWLLRDARRDAPHLTLGLTAEGDDSRYEAHKAIADACDVDFLSYGIEDLPCRFASEFRKSGRPIITWTIRSAEDAAKSGLHADQITFECFDPRTVANATV